MLIHSSYFIIQNIKKICTQELSLNSEHSLNNVEYLPSMHKALSSNPSTTLPSQNWDLINLELGMFREEQSWLKLLFLSGTKEYQ